MFARLLTIALLFTFTLPLFADEAADKAADIANMKKIWEAIQAYRKARGDLPAYLHELVPEFLPDKNVLVSPNDHSGGPLASESGDPNLPCSYGYKFIGIGKGSRNEEMKLQLAEFGGITPILGCSRYREVINISYEGEVFECGPIWERSAFVSAWLKKHQIDPAQKDSVPLKMTIVDSTGNPVEGVKVKATRDAPSYALPDRSAVSGANGVATIPVHKSLDSHNLFYFEKDGFSAHPRIWPKRDEEGLVVETEPVFRVSMHPASTLSGTIRDAAGKPVEGADLTLSALNDKGELINIHYSPRKTGKDGRWELRDIPGGGGYKVRVSQPKLRTVFERLGENSVPDLATMIAGKGDFQLLPPYEFRGKVAAAGQPVAGATIWFKSAFQHPFELRESREVASTGGDGTFTGHSSHSDKGQIVVHAKGYTPRLLEYEGHSLPIELERGKPLKGRVVDPTGNGVAGVPILMYSVGEFNLFKDLPVVATTSEDGAFEWPDAPAQVVGLRLLLPSGEELQWRGHRDQEKIEIKVPPQSN